MSMPVVLGGPVYRIYQWFWSGLDWLFPPRCGGCQAPGFRWCLNCYRGTQTIQGPICMKCGQGWTFAGLCTNCRNAPPSYTALRSWAIYGGPLRNAVRRLKYHGDLALGDVLARPMIALLQDLKWPVDLVSPVPIGIARREQRGYNQAGLLALPIGLSCNLRYRADALVKVRNVPSQVGLTASQRHENVRGAYQARQELVASMRVLVVDDVTTSGATMNACAAALLDAGAAEVYGLTLARSSHPE